MKLYERFGLEWEAVDPSSDINALNSCEQQLKRQTDDFWIDLHTCAIATGLAATRFYLIGDIERSRIYGNQVMTFAREYLLGDWRSRITTDLGTVDPTWWHGREMWLNVFSTSLLWGTACGQWERVGEIAEYPDASRSLDTDFAPVSIRQFYLELASLIRGRSTSGAQGRISNLDGASRYGADILGGVLDAIAAGDKMAVSQLIDEFFVRRHGRRRVPSVSDTVSREGTTVVHVAQRLGMNVTLNPQHEMYVVTF